MTMRIKCISGLCILGLLLASQLEAQTQTSTANSGAVGPTDRGIGYLFNYLNISGTKKAA